ncbi:ABC transporter substrate-binding protein [Aeromicrobium senzhongii]|uniref:ABC transporter substrate-binding protein n=1 Tax=Aeromicrobium senzhongii TaxID=2663859 RepID=A0ABX6SRZ6_9ACTN|nr:ABC transporter substrate-binding protein [Aeromicrobium senzhongii]QNL93505.1 ABC transporter substrate-binding protein [Aeromicrobium senzhongii]
MRLRRSALAGIAIAAVASLSLAACSSDSDDNGGGSTDSVITAYGTEPQKLLITTNTNEVGGGNIIDLLYAGLVSYDPEGEMTNEVAESIESEDNKNWTIKLKDWKFTDGTPVTAESFVKAWTYASDPKNGQLQAYFMYPFAGTDEEGVLIDPAKGLGAKAVDDKTIQVTLKEAEPEFPLRLGYSAYYPLPDAAFDESGKITDEFGEKPIGNGPYVLESWEHEVEAKLTPNDDYKGSREAKNGGVTFKFYTDPDSAYSDLQGGNLDVLEAVPPSALSSFETDDSIQAFTGNGANFASITIPERLEHWSGEEGKLRRAAISKAINREEITEKIFEGSRVPAEDFSTSLFPGFTKDIPGSEVLDFDAAEAKKLWAEADAISKFDGSFTVAYNGDGPGNKEWVEALVNQVGKNLGIEAKPKGYATFKELRELVTNREIKTAFRTGWQADYPSIYNYLGPLYGTGAGSNDGDYSNPEVDKLLKEALGAEGDEQAKKLAEVQEILFQDLPAIPLWNQRIAGAAADGVEGVVFSWQGKPEYHLVTK